MEEAEDKFEIANVARFTSVSAACLGHCLRIQPTPSDFEVVKSNARHVLTYSIFIQHKMVKLDAYLTMTHVLKTTYSRL